MIKLTLAGKEVELKCVYDDYEYASTNYNLEKIDKLKPLEHRQFTIDLIFRMMQKKTFFKPFRTITQFKKVLSLKDIALLELIVNSLLNGEPEVAIEEKILGFNEEYERIEQSILKLREELKKVRNGEVSDDEIKTILENHRQVEENKLKKQNRKQRRTRTKK